MTGSYGPTTYNINSLRILNLLIPIFETRFNIGLHDQNYNVKINGPYNQPRIFILLNINKTLLKIISSIYFNSKIFKSG